MSDQVTLSKKQLIISGIVSLVLALIVVIFFVLPAEYGEDPTGFGEVAGLDSLPSQEEPVETTVAEVTTSDEGHYVFFDPLTTEVQYDEWNQPIPFYPGKNHQSEAEGFKVETLQIELGLDEAVEYKAIMEEGGALVYQWTSDQLLYSDFHAHQDTGDPGFFTRYLETLEGNTESGSIIASYDGQHGWYWVNLGDAAANIELKIAGYFSEIIMIDLSQDY